MQCSRAQHLMPPGIGPCDTPKKYSLLSVFTYSAVNALFDLAAGVQCCGYSLLVTVAPCKP